jgi:hypothetical protein
MKKVQVITLKGSDNIDNPKNRVDLKIYNFFLGFQIFYLLMLIANPQVSKLAGIQEGVENTGDMFVGAWIYMAHILDKVHYSIFCFTFLISIIVLVYLFKRYGNSIRYAGALAIANLIFLIFNSWLSYSMLISMKIFFSGIEE